MFSNQRHQLCYTVGVDCVLFEIAEDSCERIQRPLFVHESHLRGVPNDMTVLPATLVLGEHVDLADSLARTFRHVPELEQRAFLVGNLSRVQKPDAGQFLDDSALLDVAPLGELFAPQYEVCLDMWPAVRVARVLGCRLSGVVLIAGGDVAGRHAFIRILEQVVGELALAIRQPELVSSLMFATPLNARRVRQAWVLVCHRSEIFKIVLCSTLCGTLV